MVFDFEQFTRVAKTAYQETEESYSLEDALSVFRYYFQKYEEHMGQPHPPIRASQIKKIIQDMPWICQEDRGGYCRDIDPVAYEAMIDQHFKTGYRRCDYNINHFFSGRIREMRFFEVC